MLTEEEAKTKWCPTQLLASSPGYCAGSRCMAWQWVWEDDFDAPPVMVGDGTARTPRKRNRGFCGLAGRPE